jgi:predicted phage terminase large subunit-like protein
MNRFRKSPEYTEQEVRKTAELDGWQTSVWIEEEPGSAGKMVADHYIRRVLHGYAARSHKETGNKVLRANPVSSAAERGLIKIVRGHWNKDFLDELVMFPTKGWHDDQVDALSGAFRKLKDSVSRDAAPLESVKDQSYWMSDLAPAHSENVDSAPFAFLENMVIDIPSNPSGMGGSYFVIGQEEDS